MPIDPVNNADISRAPEPKSDRTAEERKARRRDERAQQIRKEELRKMDERKEDRRDEIATADERKRQWVEEEQKGRYVDEIV